MPPTLLKCCFFQSCYPRVFGRGSRLLTAAAVEAAGARGGIIALGVGGRDGASCLFWNLSLSPPIPPPLPSQNPGGERGTDTLGRCTYPPPAHTHTLSLSLFLSLHTSHAPLSLACMRAHTASHTLTHTQSSYIPPLAHPHTQTLEGLSVSLSQALALHHCSLVQPKLEYFWNGQSIP